MKKILIIEDQKTLRDEVCDWFEFEGFETYGAGDGKEGLELARKYLPDLILCDIMMPVMDGNEVLVELRKDQVTALIPFIFMTAMAERRQVRAGMENGADDYVTKPFTRAEMLNAVNSRLKKSDNIQDQSSAALHELRHNLITSLPHELRTPLNGILGFSQLLKEDAGSFSHEEVSEFGERIHTSAMRLYRLIQNYLLYAQLELKKTGDAQQYALLNPDVICDQVARRIAVQHSRVNDLVIVTHTGGACIPETEFSKIVEEVTDNAFKFSVSGQKIKLTCEGKEGRFHLVIEDQGRGISAEDLKKMGAFMQFERTMYEQQGFGLGLIISKRIAELFDGSLTIESEQGRGTIIHVILPGC